MNKIPAFSSMALANYTKLFEAMNNVLIYVEDTDGMNLYDVMFERIGLPIPYHCIRPVGGKKQLIEIFHQVSSEKKLCLFIADADFDFLLKRDTINAINFIYLERYSIENYLIEPIAGARFLQGRLKKDLNTCIECIDFDRWIMKISTEWDKLIALMAAIQAKELPIENSGSKPGRFIKNDSYQIDYEKRKRLICEIQQNCPPALQKDFKKTCYAIKKNLKSSYGENSWHMIPGKALFEIFHRYLVSLSGIKHCCHKDDLLQTMVSTCQISNFDYIKSKIRTYLTEQGVTLTAEV